MTTSSVLATAALLLLVRILAIALVVVVIFVADEDEKGGDGGAPARGCDAFLAATPLGYGVFAGRDLVEGEIVDVSAFHVRLAADDPAHEDTVLSDYAYTVDDDHVAVHFGRSLFFNHHPTFPNLRHEELGPPDNPPHVVGFFADRDVAAGEELYHRYVDGPDGGREWFEGRGLDMREPSSVAMVVDTETLDARCSRVRSGPGRPSVRRKGGVAEVMAYPELWRDLPSYDAGPGDARAAVDAAAGTVLETTAALALPADVLGDHALVALAIVWEHLDKDHRAGLRRWRAAGGLRVLRRNPYADADLEWTDVLNDDDADMDYENLLLLPIGGNGGLIRRVGGKDEATPNCVLRVPPPPPDGVPSEVVVVLEIVATADVRKDDVLLLDLPPNDNEHALWYLMDEIDATHQPYHESIFDGFMEYDYDNNENGDDNDADTEMETTGAKEEL